MKQFACGDVVPACQRTFQGSEEQILTDVADHAREDHGLPSLPDGLVLQIRSHITSAG